MTARQQPRAGQIPKKSASAGFQKIRLRSWSGYGKQNPKSRQQFENLTPCKLKTCSLLNFFSNKRGDFQFVLFFFVGNFFLNHLGSKNGFFNFTSDRLFHSRRRFGLAHVSAKGGSASGGKPRGNHRDFNF